MYQNGYFVDLMGTGVATETGFLATPGTWSITDTNSSGGGVDFSFGASTNVSAPQTVPDDGSTGLLIAFGVSGIGLALCRRQPKLVKV